MQFSDLLPNISRHADQILMVRSMQTDEVIHLPGQLQFSTGYPTTNNPSIGSWLSSGLGKINESLPSYVVMWSGQEMYKNRALWSGDVLPGNHTAVEIHLGDSPIPHLFPQGEYKPAVEKASLDLLQKLQGLKIEELRRTDKTGNKSGSVVFSDARKRLREMERKIDDYSLIFELQTTAPDVLDLNSESQKTLDSYGVNRRGLDQDEFARNCLLARRLLENGVRFVNITHSHWDNHDEIDDELPRLCKIVDQPIAALLDDLIDRDLLKDTLVIWGTEFGRTCFAEVRNKKPGRDHHIDAFSIWAAGGGVKGGLTYGKTDDFGWEPIENPVHVRDFHATLLHLFGLDQFELEQEVSGRPVRLTNVGGRVLKELIA